MGGPQIRIALVAAALQDRLETIVVAPRKRSAALLEYCAKRGVGCRTLPLNRMSQKPMSALLYILAWPYEVLRLVGLFRSESPDIVHVNGSWQYKALVAAKLSGAKAVWHLNDTAVPGIIKLLVRVFQPLADGFIFASFRSQTYYAWLLNPRKPARVVPAPVDTNWFQPDAPCTEAVGRPLVVGTVANVNPIKGLDTLLEAANRLKATGLDVRFEIVGHAYDSQANYMAQLTAMQKRLGVNNVSFMGPTDDPRSAFARFDLYLCSSRAESSPLSVWEAMSMALPVVSTDVGDVSEFAPDGEVSRIIPVADAEAMASALEEILRDPDKRRRYGEAARRAARRSLDIQACADRHLDIYGAVCGGLGATGDTKTVQLRRTGS